MKFRGVFKTQYELRENDRQLICTKPDGKILYIPLEDVENIFKIIDLEEQKLLLIKELHAVESQLIKLNK